MAVSTSTEPSAGLSDIDVAEVRATLARHKITHARFARACGLSRPYASRLLNGYPAGELACLKLLRGLHTLGLDGQAASA